MMNRFIIHRLSFIIKSLNRNMKKFYFAIAIFFSILSRNAYAGVTVLVHGFQIKGELRVHWIDFAKAIQRHKNNDAVILKSNPNTGFWEVPEGVVNNPNPTNKTEFIFVCDWAAVSNNVFEQGSLEVAADQLYAMLSAPNGAPDPSVNFITGAYSKHFVGHSRGCILLLQVIRRIAKYHPEVKIDRFTTIDPHPTSLKDKSLWGITPHPKFNYQLTIPNNVLTADNYFRRSSALHDWYEPVTGNYSGVPVVGASLNDQKDDNILLGLNNGCTVLAHNNIGSWYYGTINPQDPIILYRDCNEKHQPPIAKWYPNGKNGIGYNAKLPLAQGIAPALMDAQKPDLQSVFNGDFEYMDYGWEGSHVNPLNKYVNLGTNKSLKHQAMYFPAMFKSLQWEAKSTSETVMYISFFDSKGVLIQTITPRTVVSKDQFQKMSVAIPQNLIGKVGSFSIQNTAKVPPIIIDNVSLIP
jgi:hypothetical protein